MLQLVKQSNMIPGADLQYMVFGKAFVVTWGLREDDPMELRPYGILDTDDGILFMTTIRKLW